MIFRGDFTNLIPVIEWGFWASEIICTCLSLIGLLDLEFGLIAYHINGMILTLICQL